MVTQTSIRPTGSLPTPANQRMMIDSRAGFLILRLVACQEEMFCIHVHFVCSSVTPNSRIMLIPFRIRFIFKSPPPEW